MHASDDLNKNQRCSVWKSGIVPPFKKMPDQDLHAHGEMIH
jgi:hypothetical protein